MKVITTTTKLEKLRHALFASSLRRKYVMLKEILSQSNFTLMIKGAEYTCTCKTSRTSKTHAFDDFNEGITQQSKMIQQN